MIINKFKRQFSFRIVQFFSIIFALIVSFILVLVFGAISETNISLQNSIIIALGITFAFLYVFPYLTKGSQPIFENFTFQSHLGLVNKEKIISGNTYCSIEGLNIFSRTILHRHVIVTNFRITIGFGNTISLFYKGKMEEKMGFSNMWGPQIKKIPNIKSSVLNIESKSKLMGFLGANTKIKDIAYGKNRRGDFVIIRPKFWFPTYLKINHPKAKLIYDNFIY